MRTQAHKKQESVLCFYFTIVGTALYCPKILTLGIPPLFIFQFLFNMMFCGGLPVSMFIYVCVHMYEYEYSLSLYILRAI